MCFSSVALGHGHDLQRYVREFAVGSLVDHDALHGFVRQRAAARQAFHNQGVDAFYGVGELWGSVEIVQSTPARKAFKSTVRTV